MYASREELLREIEAGEDSYLDFEEIGFEGRRLRLLAGGRPAERAVDGPTGGSRINATR